MTVVRN